MTTADSTALADILGLGARAKVMLLGTFHFNAQGLDYLNTKVDMMTEQRQAEIEEVVHLLERFQPTKIAVESRLESGPVLLERFQAYRAGTYELPANEMYQLGFRLAARLGHDQVYPVDEWGRHYDTEEQFMAYARSRGFTEETLRDMICAPKEWDLCERLFRHTEQLAHTGTLQQYYALVNSPECVRLSHGSYLSWPDAEPGDYIVVDYVSGWWYNRNLRIFANLKRITESPSDRILVIYGSGHLPLLRHAVETSYLHELVEVGDYLNENVSIHP